MSNRILSVAVAITMMATANGQVSNLLSSERVDVSVKYFLLLGRTADTISTDSVLDRNIFLVR